MSDLSVVLAVALLAGAVTFFVWIRRETRREQDRLRSLAYKRGLGEQFELELNRLRETKQHSDIYQQAFDNALLHESLFKKR